jgi:hypothetical protein
MTVGASSSSINSICQGSHILASVKSYASFHILEGHIMMAKSGRNIVVPLTHKILYNRKCVKSAFIYIYILICNSIKTGLLDNSLLSQCVTSVFKVL